MAHLDAVTLFASVDSGKYFDDQQRRHLQDCDDCRRLLWSYSRQQVQKLQRHSKIKIVRNTESPAA